MDNEKDLKLNEAEVTAESSADAAAVPKRKPVIRKVSAAPTKFAPKRPVEEEKNIKISENIATNIKRFYPTHFSLYIYGLCSKCNRTQKRRRQKKR